MKIVMQVQSCCAFSALSEAALWLATLLQPVFIQFGASVSMWTIVNSREKHTASGVPGVGRESGVLPVLVGHCYSRALMCYTCTHGTRKLQYELQAAACSAFHNVLAIDPAHSPTQLHCLITVHCVQFSDTCVPPCRRASHADPRATGTAPRAPAPGASPDFNCLRNWVTPSPPALKWRSHQRRQPPCAHLLRVSHPR